MIRRSTAYKVSDWHRFTFSFKQFIKWNIFSRTIQYRLTVNFLWVPAQIGVIGTEETDLLAKQAPNHAQMDIHVPLSKKEVKGITAKEKRKKWQKEWETKRNKRKPLIAHSEKCWCRKKEIWNEERECYNFKSVHRTLFVK